MPFEALRERLLKGGVAPRHVRRYLAELEDHLVELTRCEEDTGYDKQTAAIRARAALGDDALLAEAMLAQPGVRSLTARAPWAVFGLLPPFFAMAAFLVPCLALVLIAKTHGLMAHNPIVAPGWFRHLAIAVMWGSDLLLAPALAILILATAQRQRLSWKWPLLGIAIIALLGVHVGASFPLPGHHGGFINVSLLILGGWRDWQAWAQQWPLLLAQFLLTLLPVAWLLRQSGRTSEI